MQETRRMRLQSVIQEELSQIVSKKVKDPRIPPLIFTSVEVSENGSQATIFVAILESGPIEPFTPYSEKKSNLKMKNCIQGLSSASGYLRGHLGKILSLRFIPSLIFKEDRGFQNSMRVEALLKEIR